MRGDPATARLRRDGPQTSRRRRTTPVRQTLDGAHWSKDLHMRRYASATALVLVTSVAVGFAVAYSPQQKPSQLYVTSTYFLEPPRSLREMVSAAVP